MYPNVAADDSLRTRYRQPQPVQSPVHRPVRADVTARVHAPRPVIARQPSTVRPTAVITQEPVGVAVDRPVIAVTPAPPVQQQPAAVQPSVFELNLDNVPSAPVKRSKYLVKPRRMGQAVLTLMAVALFAMGGYVSIDGAKANEAVTKTAQQLSSGNAAVGAPATDKPDSKAVSTYTVAPDMPRYIRINDLKTEARILPMGVNKKGQVASPANVHDAGWFNQSAKPGQAGAVFINGHVSSWSTNGVFHNLKKAAPGMIVEIERGDGTKLQYKVVKTVVYGAQEVDMKAAINPVTPGKEGLNLMTCTGKVKSGTSEFDSRLLVMTERI